MQDFKMPIGGEERAAVGDEWIESVNPYTGKAFGNETTEGTSPRPRAS